MWNLGDRYLDSCECIDTSKCMVITYAKETNNFIMEAQHFWGCFVTLEGHFLWQ
jgi:hypothetical protein